MGKPGNSISTLRKRRKTRGDHDSSAPPVKRIVSTIVEEEEISELPLADGPRTFSMLQRAISSKKTLFTGLLLFRIFNATLVQTYFVPDEYYQSVEVAHNMVFGYGLLTWEWKEGLRGYTYPLIFAALYKVLALFHLDHRSLLIKLPRLLQAVFAAIGDYHLFKLSNHLCDKATAQWALLSQLLSWFTFYCCTRTLTNSAEAVLTTVALSHYPWPGRISPPLWKFVSLVVAAVIIRPTAAIMWVPMVAWHLWRKQQSLVDVLKTYILVGVCGLGLSLLIDGNFYGKWTMVQYNFLQFNVINNMGSFYGSHPFHWYFTQGFPAIIGPHIVPFVIGVWKARDKRLFYLLLWTLIIYSFLSHKEFRFIYPVLPLAMHYCGICLHQLCLPVVLKSRKEKKKKVKAQANKEAAEKAKMDPNSFLAKDVSDLSIGENEGGTAAVMEDTSTGYSSTGYSSRDDSDIGMGSKLRKEEEERAEKSNKEESVGKTRPETSGDEVKSIDDKHICRDSEKNGANSVEPYSEEEPAKLGSGTHKKGPTRAHIAKAITLFLLVFNLPIALYTGLIHQKGTVDVMKFVYDSSRKVDHLDALFLMPCHSTPFYSYIHGNVTLNFLTCEPNLQNIPNYLDEADIFYQNPKEWWKTEYLDKNSSLPTHVVMFSELHQKLDVFLTRQHYRDCGRFFHTHFPEGRVSSHVNVKCRKY
ncbi:GPI mannosyltransferase 3 [Lingula anatina]|uniref:Mannosyltransferase n=1 Tax=Lingula anatina TaxID=7574 RepID=A0A1S3J952_LINAN|nr:GPI mannosyltransferase 3 [Lingula anatina]|eukprot:XP_013406843.1 GPI mannosyltransferase 3 [Lingula anatina]